MTDIIIIGAGVTGCAIARALSAYSYDVTVLEANSDVCEGTSKANSGIVHAGFDCAPGTLMAKLNVRGNEMMPELQKELDFPFKQNGSLVLCFDEADMPKLHALKERGEANGVKGLRVIDRDELRAMEKNISENAVGALYAPTGGIVCPFGLTIAFAENAATNGVKFERGVRVESIEKAEEGYALKTNRGEYAARIVVNAAGVYADVIHNMICEDKLEIIPRKGEYCLMDRAMGDLVRCTVFQLPTQYGKGVLVTPTVHGNILVGPTAVDVGDKQTANTTADGLADVLKRAALSVRTLDRRQIITSFVGLRAHRPEHDFLIGEVAPGFIDAAGIESPGLTSAPAIGEMVRDIVLGILPREAKPDFNPYRKNIPQISALGNAERAALIAGDSRYANIICRCETVTEGEIVEAIHRPVGAVSVDGVKRRTRAGMGRCQSGFCLPKTAQILARELHVGLEEITKSGEGSPLLVEGE